MRRKCTEKLLQWKKNPKRKPLVLTGGRQTGKTWLLQEFGKKNYENVIYINLETERPGGRFPQQPQRCRGDPSVPGILREQTPAPGQNTADPGQFPPHPGWPRDPCRHRAGFPRVPCCRHRTGRAGIRFPARYRGYGDPGAFPHGF